MPQAVVDPNELRRFAQQLKRFNGDLRGQMSLLRGQLAGLAATWRDQEQIRFAEEFDQTMAVVNKFLEASDQHVPFLLRKAQKVEDYLHQR